MKYLMLSFLSTTLFAITASAVNTADCPKSISFKATVDKVHQSSIYSTTTGWKSAQLTLSKISSFDSNFILRAKKSDVCLYSDAKGNQANLSTASFQDPEERDPTQVDQLTVTLKSEDSTYVSFIPLRSYSENGVQIQDDSLRVKIKTQLYVEETQRNAIFDLGMITVNVR